MSKNYYRIRAGKGNKNAEQCYQEGWIGGSWNVAEDLSQDINELNFKELLKNKVKKKYSHDASPKAIGIRTDLLHQICKDIQQGDIILCDNGEKGYFIGTITSDYYFADDANDLRHRRKVSWDDDKIPKKAMSPNLQDAVLGSFPKNTRTVFEIINCTDEIDKLCHSGDHRIQDEASSPFKDENDLEKYLIDNWTTTDISENYNIFGQQYKIGGNKKIDILARSKDKKEYLVIELKKGKASANVVDQISKYIEYVEEKLTKGNNQKVRGCIIAWGVDESLQWTLKGAKKDIDFYQYNMSFALEKLNPS